MPRPLRTSCDRCHSQKLRCPKQPGTTTCVRCSKAGALCVFSPAGANTRRTLPYLASEGEAPPREDAHNTYLGLDWPPWEFHGSLPMLPETQATTLPPTPDLQIVDPRSNCVQQLSALSLDIDNTYNLIPPNSDVHMPKDGPIEEFINGSSVKFAQRQCLEQLFASSQRLIDLYPSIIDIIFKESDADDCDNADCIHRQALPNTLRELGPFITKACEARILDSFVFNLLIACHSHVIDVLEVLLVHVSTCAKVTLSMPETQEPQLHIPELKVGNFVASPQSSSSMQAVLLVHVTSVLADRARQLEAKVTKAFEKRKSTKLAYMYKLQCEMLVEANESNVVALQRIRDGLTKIGYMR